jgi:hypothetical protein
VKDATKRLLPIVLIVALFMRAQGCRAAVLLGLGLYGTGALLFRPAAGAQSYPFFLLSLFIIASGLAFLETSANPRTRRPHQVRRGTAGDGDHRRRGDSRADGLGLRSERIHSLCHAVPAACFAVLAFGATARRARARVKRGSCI